MLFEQWDLRNRYLHIAPSPQWQEQACIEAADGAKDTTAMNDVPQDVLQDVPQAIIALIKDNPKVTRKEIALHLHLSVKTIGRHIAKLPNVRYVGSGYSGHWEILHS